MQPRPWSAPEQIADKIRQIHYHHNGLCSCRGNISDMAEQRFRLVAAFGPASSRLSCCFAFLRCLVVPVSGFQLEKLHPRNTIHPFTPQCYAAWRHYILLNNSTPSSICRPSRPCPLCFTPLGQTFLLLTFRSFAGYLRHLTCTTTRNLRSRN